MSVHIQSTVVAVPQPEPHVGFAFTVTTGQGLMFPDPRTVGPYNLTLSDAVGSNSPSYSQETVRVFGRNVDAFTINRAQNGDNPRHVKVGDVVTFDSAVGGQFNIKVTSDTAALTTGDGQFIFTIPSDIGGTMLANAQAYVTTVSSSGLPTVQVRNVTTGFDMLTTPITVDVSEFTSYTAATPSVIDVTHNLVSTSNMIALDIDVAGTGAMGLGVMLTFV